MKIIELINDLDNITFEETLEYIVKNVQKNVKIFYVVTPNTEIFMLERKQKDYRDVIRNADLALADSIGVMWAAKTLGKPLKERIPGADLMERLCLVVAKKPITVGFLGGNPGVALEASKRLVKKYPGLKVAFALDEWPDVNDHLASKADILFVAFGSPKQEYWLSQNLAKIGAKVGIGVGGSFDFASGRVKRAPQFMRNAGLEWLFRLVIQPWRIKRQLRLAGFVFLVLREKIQG